VLFFILIFLPSSGFTRNTHTILILGDSLSAAFSIDRSKSWVSLLQQRLITKGYAFKVVNASISGDTTQSGISRMPFVLKKHHPDIVVIALGGNDGLRGLPLKLSQQNLQKMIQLARQNKAKVIICGVRLPPNLGPVFNKKFQTMFATLANKNNVAFVPALMKNVSDQPALLQDDGIHPTAAGQPIMLENVWPVLLPLITATLK